MKIVTLSKKKASSILAATGLGMLMVCGPALLAQSHEEGGTDYTAVAGSVDYHIVGGDRTVRFVTSELGLQGDVVKNAPYSAEDVTTMTQTLADGNRILRETTAVLYRDSEGRTRREQTLTGIGPWAWVSPGEAVQVIVISDPVAGVRYTLHPSTHTATAHRMPSFESFESLDSSSMYSLPGMPVQGTGEESVAVEQGGTPQETTDHYGGGLASSGTLLAQYQELEVDETELLGTRILEGVVAEGTRSTVIIPAGSIGNEQPIEVSTERWYSSQLQALVMSRHSDPRFGETVYQLKNISTAEPGSDLFEVPSDYEIAVPLLLSH